MRFNLENEPRQFINFRQTSFAAHHREAEMRTDWGVSALREKKQVRAKLNLPLLARVLNRFGMGIRLSLLQFTTQFPNVGAQRGREALSQIGLAPQYS